MNSSSMSTNSPTVTIEKQPRALYILFFAEMWERFSFYGMHALLALYMTKELMYERGATYGVIGAYGALVYGSSVLGGYLSDNFLGNRRSVMVGSLLIITGHITLALPFAESFYYGLAFLVVGTGFFKPNISSFLGRFYHKDDPRRDSGFTIFYMGINVGGMMAPLICGTIGEAYGYHYGFGVAAIGMMLGAVVFQKGAKDFGEFGHPPDKDSIDKPIVLGLSLSKLITIGAFVLVPLTAFMIQHHDRMGDLLTLTGVLTFGSLSYLAMKSDAEERKCMFTLMLMFVLVACFFAIFKQLGGSILLFMENNIDREVAGFLIPASWSQSLNPVFIITFAPIVSAVWLKLGRRKIEPITPVKFVFGFAVSAIGFYLFVLGIQNANDQGLVSLWWLVAGFGFFTLGEIFISPVGLSMVTKLAPKQFAGLLMGSYFLALSFANFIAQKIAQIFGAPEGVDVQADKFASLEAFNTLFMFVTKFALASMVVALIIVPIVRKVFKRHG